MFNQNQHNYSLPLEEQSSYNYTYERRCTMFKPDFREKDISEIQSANNDTDFKIDKKENYSEKKNESHLQHIEQQENKHIKQKIMKKSLLHEWVNKRINCSRNEIVVYYFNSKKNLIFQKMELMKLSENSNGIINVRNFITYAIKRYCKFNLNFEPLQVTPESFQLKLANLQNVDDGILDSIDPEQDVSRFYEAGNLVLIRKKRTNQQRLEEWQKNLKKPLQVIEIVIPVQQRMTETIEDTKTINDLKQKIANSHKLGKIVIVQYNTFQLCEGTKKISELKQKILEIFREKLPTYDDVPIRKPIKQQPQYTIPSTILKKQEQEDIKIQVNESLYFGKLSLHIIGPSIIEKYEGGLISYFYYPSKKERFIYNLIAIGSDLQSLKLKFKYKDFNQTVHYAFDKKDEKERFMKQLIRLGREYNRNFIKFQ